jgi:hypothetical protein
VSELKVLIIGGYGTFGGRIVELLEDQPRLTLIIAGRSLERAQGFRDTRIKATARLLAVAFDRDRDVRGQLRALGPDVVVDASGPFQNYGAERYRVVDACIALRMNYLDLADGADFVAGVAAFDAAAREEGVFVLSGVSTFPVLSAAAVRHLAPGMVRIDTIRGGIAPSPFAGVGANVIRAIAGYAGKPVRVRRNGADRPGNPFTSHLHRTIAPPGHLPLRNRLFSLVDVPDSRVLVELWPGAKSVWMGAAPVPEILHRALILCAWLVRLRLVPGLAPLAPVMHFATNHLRWGEHRGGMFVTVEGTDQTGTSRRRTWHMIAEGNDGPYIPSMAVAALLRKALQGQRPGNGARAATRELELQDYQALFAGRRIVSGVRDDDPLPGLPLYARVLGCAWDRLPEEIRAMHNVTGHASASGRASVERGRGLLSRFVGKVVGFPDAAETTRVRVRFDVRNGAETWARTFGGQSFSSRQFAGRGQSESLLCERFGPLTFAMALVPNAGELSLVLRRWSLFGVPLPLGLGPGSVAYEGVDAGKFRFHVEISHKLTGLIVRYRGWLEPDAEVVTDDPEQPHG